MRAAPLALALGAALLSHQACSQSNPSAFADGLHERMAWENWYTPLGGEIKDGATWWASHRSLKNPGSCADPSMAVSAAWRSGCDGAVLRLGPADVRRKAEPSFRSGWNSYGTSASAPSPASPPSSLIRDAAANCNIVGANSSIPSGSTYDPRLQALAQDCAERKREAQIKLDDMKAVADRAARQQAEAARLQAETAAEMSSSNHCRDTEIAGAIIDEIDKIQADRFPVRKVVDIEHLTTKSWSENHTGMACHGTFIFDNGWRIAATYSERQNVAGRMIAAFTPD